MENLQKQKNGLIIENFLVKQIHNLIWSIIKARNNYLELKPWEILAPLLPSITLHHFLILWSPINSEKIKKHSQETLSSRNTTFLKSERSHQIFWFTK